jgi:hypothetical protein
MLVKVFMAGSPFLIIAEDRRGRVDRRGKLQGNLEGLRAPLRWLERLVGAGLGVLFLLAAVWKLGDLAGFQDTIGRFGIVLDALVPATALLLVAAELAVGLGLIAGLRAALHGALALVLLFLGVLAYGLHLGLDIDCGCFGPGERADLAQALRRDLVLLGLCVLLYWSRARRERQRG